MGDRGEEPVGEEQGLRLVVHVGDDDELVPAEAGDRVSLSSDSGETFGDPSEERVAGQVAERVVDHLEPVEVEEQHRQRATSPAELGLGLDEAVHEQDAVGQPGQGVVRGLVGDHPLGLAPLLLEGTPIQDQVRQRAEGLDPGELLSAEERRVAARPDQEGAGPQLDLVDRWARGVRTPRGAVSTAAAAAASTTPCWPSTSPDLATSLAPRAPNSPTTRGRSTSASSRWVSTRTSSCMAARIAALLGPPPEPDQPARRDETDEEEDRRGTRTGSG